MGTTVTGKLNKNASRFSAGESTGFGVRIGVKYYDRETKQNEFTNYEAAIFAKAQGQIDFYDSALVEGSIVELTGDAIKVRKFDGQNGQVITLELLNAKLGYVGSAGSQSGQSKQPSQHQSQQGNQGFQQPNPIANEPDFSFDDDVPF